MGTVHIGISHDDDLMISEFADIKIIMDSCSKRCDHGLNLGIAVYLVETGLLYIENLTSQREDCLGCTVSRGLCGTAGGISLYDINLTIFRILVRAVCQFSRK